MRRTSTSLRLQSTSVKYEARKYAFVSDYVRLWALEQYGGVYVDRMGKALITKGFIPSRDAQYIEEYGLRIYTHDYFSPITSTRVMRKTKNTYSIHYFAESWRDGKRKRGWRDWTITREIVNALVQVKRKLLD